MLNLRAGWRSKEQVFAVRPRGVHSRRGSGQWEAAPGEAVVVVVGEVMGHAVTCAGEQRGRGGRRRAGALDNNTSNWMLVRM